jgi:hypothetical protein
MFEIIKRPSAFVRTPYCVPEGRCTATTVAPARGSFFSSTTSPLRPEVVIWPKALVKTAPIRKMVRLRFNRNFFMRMKILGFRIIIISTRLM